MEMEVLIRKRSSFFNKAIYIANLKLRKANTIYSNDFSS